MNPFTKTIIALTLPLTATIGATQSPCFPATSPIQAAGFEQIPTLLFPWTISGTATFESGQSVDGRTTSRCLRAESAVTASQPAPFTLDGGVPYEFGFDVQSRYRFGVSYRIDLFDSTGTLVHRSSSQSTRGVAQRRRVMTRYTPPATGQFTISIATSWLTDIDNVYVRRQPIMLSVRDQRIAGASNTLDLSGPSNANFALFVSLTGRLPQPFTLGNLCAGEWWLGGTIFSLSNGVLSNNGAFAIPIDFPIELAGAALEWQPMLLPPACEFGCPSTFDFF